MDGQVSTSPLIERANKDLLAKRTQLGLDEPTKPLASFPKIPQPSEESDRRAREYEQNKTERAEQAERFQVRNLICSAGLPDRHRSEHPKKEGPWWAKAQTLEALLGKGYLISLLGKRGTGKTQLGVHLILCACRAMKAARYAKAMDIFLNIRSSFRNDGPTEQSCIDDWVKPQLLVVDELQERGESAWEDRILVHIIDRRYDTRRDTVLISNLTESEFTAAVGPSIASRIQECGGHVICDWPSFREVKHGQEART